ncbi:MAG: ketopantoate reductase family protein [Paracoccaceae bacterium]
MAPPHKLYVLGAGAMGSLFGGLLAEGGMDVTLIDPWKEHVDAIVKNGLKMVGFGGERCISVNAALSAKGLPPADIVFVQCKAIHSHSAMSDSIAIIGPETAVISFQNGLGNEELLADIVGADKVLGGLTAQGASIEAPGAVRNYAELPSWIGEMAGGQSQRATALAALFSAHGLPTSASENIRLDIWRKLMANVGISAPSGIGNLKIREVMALPEMNAAVYAAIDEAVAVSEAIGLDLDPEDAREVLAKIIGPGGSGENKTSLCNDLLNKRPSEIDFINGAIVKLGKENGVATPVNATLVAAVKAIESHFTGADT